MTNIVKPLSAMLLLVLLIIILYQFLSTSIRKSILEKEVTPNFNFTTIVHENTSIRVLLDTGYYYSLLNDIRRANNSIYVVMFIAKYDENEEDDPVNTILSELARAHKRGVSVKVILEYKYARGSKTLEINIPAYRFLKEHGIAVKLDNSPETLHAKVAVIDGKISYVGSQNWSESGLKYNREVSVRIVSEEVAKVLVEYFERLWSSE